MIKVGQHRVPAYVQDAEMSCLCASLLLPSYTRYGRRWRSQNWQTSKRAVPLTSLSSRSQPRVYKSGLKRHWQAVALTITFNFFFNLRRQIKVWGCRIGYSKEEERTSFKIVLKLFHVFDFFFLNKLTGTKDSALQITLGRTTFVKSAQT